MITATSTEQSTESSCAFLNSPPFRFRKVTDRFLSSLIGRILIHVSYALVYRTALAEPPRVRRKEHARSRNGIARASEQHLPRSFGDP